MCAFPDSDVERRSFIGLLVGGAVAAGLPACSRSNAALPELAQILGLRAEEQTWLSDLSTGDQRRIYQALTAGKGPVADGVAELTTKVIGARSRLFSFLNYPVVSDERSVCDGLIQE